jgi:hypothetical protein
MSLQSREWAPKRLMEEVPQEPITADPAKMAKMRTYGRRTRSAAGKPADSANEPNSGKSAGREARAAGDDERGDRPSRPPGLTLTHREGPWP